MSEETPREAWAGDEYAAASGHHRTADEWFLDRHPPGSSDEVVDVGCGSGEFTVQLARLVPHGRVTGVDRNESMLAQARRHEAPNLRFALGSAEDVDEVVESGSADLVISRAMLHWLPGEARQRFFEAALRVLRPGGTLHVEGGGTGNIRTISALMDDLAARHGLPPVPPFPETDLVFEEVEAAGFEVPTAGVCAVAQRRRFDETGIVALLRTQVLLVLTRFATPEVAAAVERDALESLDRLRHRDGGFDQTFVRLDVLARKPAAAH